MNRHLNIFNFFNGGSVDYLEDNLSGAFALCLKYDRVFWLRPTVEESKNTHNLRFFNDLAGKHQREDWHKVVKAFEQYIFEWKDKCYVPNWKGKSDWSDKFEKTNRSHFDLSMGTLLTVYLPYKECQQLDDAEINPRIADKIRGIISEIRQTIDGI